MVMNKSNVYAEVYFFINQLPYSYSNALPKELINELEENMSKEHYDSLDSDKLLIDQNPNKETIDMILSLSKYWLENDDLELIQQLLDK